MLPRTKLLSLFLGLAIALPGYSQSKFTFKRELSGISTLWHRIELPDDLITELQPGLYDIRILGITEQGDTIEAPYLLRTYPGEFQERESVIEIRNRSSNTSGYYYTVVVNPPVVLNELELQLEPTNYDLRVKLEGSPDEKQWFTLMDNYRIAALKTASVEFQFTRVAFPASKYGFYRIQIKTSVDPGLQAVKARYLEQREARNKVFAVRHFTQAQTRFNQTQLDIVLDREYPVSSITLRVKDALDYWRPMDIRYRSDSIQSERGWQQRYIMLTSSILRSTEPAVFHFPQAVTSQVRVTIQNRDDEPLTIDSVVVQGYVHELVGRFSKPASYALYYGSDRVGPARYDIGNFTSQVPEDAESLTAGPVIRLKASELTSASWITTPWLWMILGVIMLLMAFYTLRMMKRV